MTFTNIFSIDICPPADEEVSCPLIRSSFLLSPQWPENGGHVTEDIVPDLMS